LSRATPSSIPPAVAPVPDRSWLPPLLIAAAAFAAYANGLRHPFVFDDLPAIVTNPSIRSLSHLGTVLTPPADGSSVTGRPLVNLSFALNYALGGTNPLGYHLGNLLIHVLAALILYGLVRRTLARPVLAGKVAVPTPLFAGAVALLWVLHPLQTESVSFTVQRTESLMGLCYLATLYGFVRSVDSLIPLRWQAFTLAVCALGMTAKEVMVTAPVLVLLYDRTFVAGSFAGALRTRKVFYAGLAATWLPLLWLLTGGGGTRGASAGLGLGVSWWSYALKQCEAIVLYLKLTVWPHPLVLDYGTAVVTRPLTVLPQLLFVLALVAVLLGAAVCQLQGMSRLPDRIVRKARCLRLALQPLQVVGRARPRQVVENGDFVAIAHEPRRRVAADEPGAAGDEDLHALRLPAARARLRQRARL